VPDQQSFGPNGFDFGLSTPKTGLGYGLFGDIRRLRTQMGSHDCGDCAPEAPCTSCQEAELGLGSEQGQIIKTQVPIPVPGLFPSPPIGLLPSPPSRPIVIGDPNAWWNWTPGEIADWAVGVVEARPSKEVTAECEAQFEQDKVRCEELRKKAEQIAGAQAGYREWQECHKTAMTRYGECRSKNGKALSPPYLDWYGGR
jgi:hypothetical protein